MARFRHKKTNLNQTSRSPHELIKIRIKLGEFEFEAEGNENTVARQFEKFQELVTTIKIQPTPNPTPNLVLHKTKHHDSSSKDSPSLPHLEEIFQNDPRSSLLLCHRPPSGKEGQEANVILLLLLGYRELRATEEVSVLVLKQALKRSSFPVSRLDRILHNYQRERFVLKSGRGKGGKYRLTSLGLQKARAMAAQLLTTSLGTTMRL